MNIQSTTLYKWITVLAVIGISLALFLLWEQLARPAFQPCYINSSINCDAVISGPVAKTLGLPTPLFGLVGYIVILFASLYKKKKLLLSMVLFGFAFCFYIAYREIIELKVLCPVCIGCDIDITLSTILAILLYRRKES